MSIKTLSEELGYVRDDGSPDKWRAEVKPPETDDDYQPPVPAKGNAYAMERGIKAMSPSLTLRFAKRREVMGAWRSMVGFQFHNLCEFSYDDPPGKPEVITLDFGLAVAKITGYHLRDLFERGIGPHRVAWIQETPGVADEGLAVVTGIDVSEPEEKD